MISRDHQNAMIKHIASIGKSTLFFTFKLVGIMSLIFGILLAYGHAQGDMDKYINYIVIYPFLITIGATLLNLLYARITVLDEWELTACTYFPWEEKAKLMLEEKLKNKKTICLLTFQKIYKIHLQELEQKKSQSTN